MNTSTADSAPDFDLHSSRPSVFLDRWVWIRLAKALNGTPQVPDDAKVLEAVGQAGLAGVAFPITSAFYIEGLRTSSERQRADLARTIATLAYCRTIRAWHVLVRHQLLQAMHEHFGRPTFRPTAPEPLGVGIFWAVLGAQAAPGIYNDQGPIDPSILPGGRSTIRKMAQFADMEFLTGARAADLEDLRKRGYRPEVTIEAGNDRLAWEQTYEGILANSDQLSNGELRIRIQARELMHDHWDLFVATLREYGLSLSRLGFDSTRQPETRNRISAFTDAIPTLRIAVDLKQHLFRDARRPWKINDLYDIDAISHALPYGHAVLVDGMMTDFLGRSAVACYSGTRVLRRLTDLLDLLPELSAQATLLGGAPTGWEWAGPGEGFRSELPKPGAA